MARLQTVGFETQDAAVGEGLTGSSGFVFDGTHAGPGGMGARANVSATFCTLRRTVTGVLGTRMMMCAYITITTSPNADIFPIDYEAGSGFGALKLATDGTVTLGSNANGDHAHSSAGAVTTGTYRFELEMLIVAAGTDTLRGAVYSGDSTTAIWDSGDVTGIAISTTAITEWRLVDNTFTGDITVDDVIVNDTSGSSETTQPGPQRAYMIRPTGFNSAGDTSPGNWQKPGGNTSAPNTALDNAPPVFGSDSTSAANAENFLRNPTSAALSNRTLTFPDYITAGIGASDVVKVMYAVGIVGCNSTTATAGTIGVISNPSQTETVMAYTGSGSVAGPTDTTWKRAESALIYAPTVTKATAINARIAKTSAATRVAMCNFLGVLVSVTPVSAVSDNAPRITATGAGRTPTPVKVTTPRTTATAAPRVPAPKVTTPRVTATGSVRAPSSRIDAAVGRATATASVRSPTAKVGAPRATATGSVRAPGSSVQAAVTRATAAATVRAPSSRIDAATGRATATATVRAPSPAGTSPRITATATVRTPAGAPSATAGRITATGTIRAPSVGGTSENAPRITATGTVKAPSSRVDAAVGRATATAAGRGPVARIVAAITRAVGSVRGPTPSVPAAQPDATGSIVAPTGVRAAAPRIAAAATVRSPTDDIPIFDPAPRIEATASIQRPGAGTVLDRITATGAILDVTAFYFQAAPRITATATVRTIDASHFAPPIDLPTSLAVRERLTFLTIRARTTGVTPRPRPSGMTVRPRDTGMGLDG